MASEPGLRAYRQGYGRAGRDCRDRDGPLHVTTLLGLKAHHAATILTEGAAGAIAIAV